MINHIVMWKLKDFAEGRTKEENIDILIKGYEDLKKHIPQIKDAYIKRNINEKDSNFDTILFTKFNSIEEMESYLLHPEHKKYSELCKKLRDDRACIDFEY